MSPRRRKTDRVSGLNVADLASGDGAVGALLHELKVHSEEITVQNEQLLKAQIELEEARDRYADLYDFSPFGYLTLDHHGVIRQVNIAATAMLEKQRSFVLGIPLVNLVSTASRAAFRRFLAEARDRTRETASVEVELRTVPKRVVCLVTKPVRSRQGPQEFFTAMLDVTTQRQLEDEKQTAFAREQRKAAELAAEVEVRLAAEDRIKALLERLVSVQEQERRRLALNLHDHLGQQLTALRLSLSAVREASDPVEQAKRFELIEQIVSQLDRDVDFLAWELRPAALDDVGLEAALAEFVRQWSWANGVVADLHHSSTNVERLHPDIESNIYRIVQEALNNVAKHARATHVSVILERRGDEFAAIVEDDGCGFEVADEATRLRKGSMGLAGIRERTALIGGTFELESAPEKGTTLFIRVPLPAAPPANLNEET